MGIKYSSIGRKKRISDLSNSTKPKPPNSTKPKPPNSTKPKPPNSTKPKPPSNTPKQELEKIKYKDAEWFSFNKMKVIAKVVKVYDGDTCTCVFNTFDLGFFKHRIRLEGIDTPEIKSHNPKEKERAIECRDFVRNLILDKIVILICNGTDKYGRILGTIITEEGEELNSLLIKQKFANIYDGGKKQKFDFE